MEEFKNRRVWGPMPRYPLAEKYVAPSKEFITVAGPCFAESEKLMNDVAKELRNINIKYLRGGCARMGTYPTDDFGFKADSLRALSNVAERYGMLSVAEINKYGIYFDANHQQKSVYEFFNKMVDALQIGSRQMQNYPLLMLAGQTGKNIFLKRNQGAKIDEWLGAAEYIIKYGGHPILVERGSSTFMNHVRWDLSISAIPAIKAIAPGIPVLVDPSHGTGRRDLVEPMLLAGIAAGADGFMIEVHPEPEKSLSDSDQAFPLAEFPSLMKKVMDVYYAVHN